MTSTPIDPRNRNDPRNREHAPIAILEKSPASLGQHERCAASVVAPSGVNTSGFGVDWCLMDASPNDERFEQVESVLNLLSNRLAGTVDKLAGEVRVLGHDVRILAEGQKHSDARIDAPGGFVPALHRRQGFAVIYPSVDYLPFLRLK